MRNLMIKAVAFAALSVSCLAADGWLTDFEKAKALAKKENKDLLMEFTGSDWCPPCMRLAKNVFDKEEFLEGAQKKFVLLKLDYPRKKTLPAAETKQNEMLATRYGVAAFPTVYLADGDGLPYAMVRSAAQSPTAYLKTLDDLLPVKDEMEKSLVDARKLNGKEKARAIEKAVFKPGGVEPSMAHEAILKEILAADPADESGLATTVMMKAKMDAVTNKGEVDAAFQQFDAFVTKSGAKGEDKQQMLLAKLDVLYRVKDFSGMRTVVDKIIKVDPESAISKNLTSLKPRIDQMEKGGK